MYVESNIREIQMLELKILKAVVELCDKHHICYYISCGTLLGAVRHQGFIPWDNDVDIEMPIKDYHRFLRIAKKELPDYLFLKTYKTCKGYNEMWAKVCANGTTSLPLIWKDWKDIHWGIGLDIFPLTGLYENKILKSVQQRLFGLCRTLLAKEYIVSINPSELEGNRKLQLLYKIPRCIRTFICDLSSHFIMKNTFSSRQVSIIDHGIRFPMKIEAYKETAKLPFENCYFSAPADSDYVLTAMYGDYMIPPPVEEQTGHEFYFGKVIYSCVTDYRDILKELNG